MPVVFRANAIEPKPQASVKVNQSLHSTWMKEMKTAFNEQETGWKNITEARENKALFVLDTVGNRAIFCKNLTIHASTAEMQEQILEMMHASAEGRLFIRERETGMLMQLNTSQLDQNGIKLELSAQQRQVPGVNASLMDMVKPMAKPERPSIFTYIASLFSAKYAQKVANYKANLALYQEQQKGIVSLPAEKVNLHAGEPAQGQQMELKNESVQNEGMQNEGVQNEQKQPETITRGLKPYDAHVVSQAMSHMTYEKKTVPQNTLGIDGTQLGVLVTMALASPDLSIKMKDGSLQNNPDETYKKVIDRYKDNVAIDKKGRTGGFLSKAKNAVIEGMEAAQNSGDYSKLGKLVAQGLIQNNKVLMDCKQLDDRFSTYATIGARVLDMLNDNEQLKQATLEALGNDTKQLEMANAAKNINNLRVEAMPLYEKMLNEFSQTVKKRTWDKDTGKAKMKPDNATMGNTRDLTKVLQLCNIEVAMNAGEFNLQTTEYAKNGVVEKYSQELGKSSVLISFLAGENRVETLKDPMKMKDLYVNATNERKQAAEEIQQARLEMAMENQPKEQSVVSMPQ